jgi:hypothetical protein
MTEEIAPQTNDANPETEATEVETTEESADGQELEIDDDELVKGYQLSKTSYKRLEDASRLKKQYEPIAEVFEALKKGDIKRLEKLDIPEGPLREWMENWLLDKIEFEQLPEESKELHRTKKELEEYKAKGEAARKQAEAQERAQAYDQAAKRLETEMVEALQEYKVPKGDLKYVVSRTAFWKDTARVAGQDISVKQAMQRTLNELKGGYGSYATLAYEQDPKAFIAGLPKQVLDGIRRFDLEQVQSQLPIGNKVDPGFEPRRKSRESSDAQAFREWRKEQMKRG